MNKRATILGQIPGYCGGRRKSGDLLQGRGFADE